MRLVAAPDKFRGTLTAPEAAAAIARAASSVGWDADRVPLADGGEGTLDAFGGPNRRSLVTGPAGTPVEAAWRLSAGRAVVETARASGLLLAGGATRNDPMTATSRGTGELVARAIAAGAVEVLVGVGGSAMTDGGSAAVDVLAELAPLDGSRGWTVTVLCDVRTVFGRAATDFSPQKGASPDQVRELGGRLDVLAADYFRRFGADIREVAGGGAAGGLGGGLAALGARLVDGAASIADHVGLPALADRCDLLVTGEGQLDATSFDGKVVGTVATMGRGRAVPTLAVVGADRLTAGWSLPPGVEVVSLTDRCGAERSYQDTARCVTEVVASYLAGVGVGGI